MKRTSESDMVLSSTAARSTPDASRYQVLGGPCLDVVRRALIDRGWKDFDGNSRQTENQPTKSKANDSWRFQWGVRASYVRHASLKSDQVCNYLQGSACLSSKLQLRTNMEISQRWNFDEEAATCLPRCYDITPIDASRSSQINSSSRISKSSAQGSSAAIPSEQESHDVPPGDEEWLEFQQRFRCMQAVNVCKYFLWRCKNEVRENNVEESIVNIHSFPAADLYNPSIGLAPKILQHALIGVKQYLRLLQYDSTDENEDLSAVEQDLASSHISSLRHLQLSTDEWSSIDSLASSIIRDDTSLISPSPSSAPNMSVEFIRDVSDSIRAVEALDIQSALNRRNLWILKPSALSRGRGIQTVGSLAEIHRIIHASDDEAIPSLASSASNSNKQNPSSILRVRSAGSSNRAANSKTVASVNPRRATLTSTSGSSHSSSSNPTSSTSAAPPLDSTSRTCKFLIQKYIENPLLVQKKKFDIRQWIVVTGFQGKRNVWIWGSDLSLQDFHTLAQERKNAQQNPTPTHASSISGATAGREEDVKPLSAASQGFYLRFSSFDFSLLNLNSSIHLTNNSIQKTFTEDFNQLPFDAPGNMWSREQFLRFLIDLHGGDATRAFESWRDDVWGGIKKMTMAVVEAAEEKIVYQDNCYEIFGLDVMIAVQYIPATASSPASFRLVPLLLEVNSSPTMVGIHVPHLVDNMVKDLLSVVLDDRDSMFMQDNSRKQSVKSQVKRGEKLPSASSASSSVAAPDASVAQSSDSTVTSSATASFHFPTIRSTGGWILISSIPRNMPVRGGIDMTVRGNAILTSKKPPANKRG